LFPYPEFPSAIKIRAKAAIVQVYLPNAISLVTPCETGICPEWLASENGIPAAAAPG
jgi:hypothetical protein